MHMSSYVSSLLNHRLPAAVHDYLDLPTEQVVATTTTPLQVSLAWGNLTISGMHFRSSLLQRLLGLPIQLTQAEINRASLQIPWFTLLWKPVVLELDGITVVVAAGADASVASASRALKAPGQPRARPQKQSANSAVWLHALLRWALQKIVVRITAVSVRYESVGRCPYQQSGPAAVELWLGALELNGIPTVSAAPNADSSSDSKPLGGTLTLQQLAVGVESLHTVAGAADTEQPSWLLLQSTTVALSACVDMQTDRRQITAALAVHGANAQQPVAVVLPQTAVALAWGVAEELMLLFTTIDTDSTEYFDTAEVWYDAIESEQAEADSACEHTDSTLTAAAVAAAVSDTTAVAKAAAVPLKLILTAEISGVSVLCEPDDISNAASIKPVHAVIQRVRLSVDTVLATAERQAVVWFDVLSATATQTGRSKPLIVLQHSADSTKQDAVWLRADVKLQSNVLTASCKLGDCSVTTVLAAYRAVTSCVMPITELQLAMACNKHVRQQRTAAAAIAHSESFAAAITADTIERQPLEYSIDVTLHSVTVKLPIQPMKDSSRAVCITLSGIAAAGEQRLASPLTASLFVGGLTMCHNSSAAHEAATATTAAANTTSTTTLCSVDDLLAVQLKDRTLTVAVAHITTTATAQQIIETAWACGTALGGVHYTPYVQLKQAATATAAVRKAHIMLPQCATVTNSLQVQWSGLHIVVLPSSRHNRVGVGPEKLLYTMPWCSAVAATTNSSDTSEPLVIITVGDVYVSINSRCTVNSSSSRSSSKRKLHPLHSELELTVVSITVEACTAGTNSATTQQQHQQQQSIDSHMLQMVSLTNFMFTKQTDLQPLTTAAAALSIGTLHTVSSVHVSDVSMQLEPVLIGRLVHLAVACGAAARVGRESIECTLAAHKQQQAAALVTSIGSGCVDGHSVAVSAAPVLSPVRHSVATDMNITIDSVVLGMRCQVSCLLLYIHL
jgi:N-terminal region of Chorein or VPS13